jgi:3-hydroxybutyrate dehydrogenase
MDAPTILVLTVQLTALFSIAGALLLYLLCKVRGQDATTKNGREGSVLITSADTALGLQLSTYLANKGCRVFAGMKDPEDSLPAKLLKGWMKTREDAETPVNGSIVLFKIDVTREDVLREATDAMGAYLNAGERGISAVINTSGSVHRGRIEQQESAQWENMLKSNVLGCLRITRAFIGLLRPTRGRFIFLGCGNNGDGLVAFTATRNF